MKGLIPQTRMGWLRFILLPAKIYVVLTPFTILLAGKWGGLDFRWDTGTRNLFLGIICGYMVCLIILVIGAGMAAFARHWKDMLMILFYAVIGLLLLGFLLPAVTLSR